MYLSSIHPINNRLQNSSRLILRLKKRLRIQYPAHPSPLPNIHPIHDNKSPILQCLPKLPYIPDTIHHTLHNIQHKLLSYNEKYNCNVNKRSYLYPCYHITNIDGISYFCIFVSAYSLDLWDGCLMEIEEER